MTERPFPKFRAAALTGYTGPMEGGDLIPFVGYAIAKVMSGTKKWTSGTPSNPGIQWGLQLVDDPNIQVPAEFKCGGLSLPTTKAYSGDDRNGQGNERQTADILASAQVMTIADFQAHAAAGTEFDPDQLIASVVGREVTVKIGRYTRDDGTQASSVDNFVLREKYNEMAQTPGSFRQQPPANAPSMKKAGGQVTAPIGVPNIGGPGVRAPGALGAVPAPRAPGVPGVPGVPTFATPAGNSTLAAANALPPPPRAS